MSIDTNIEVTNYAFPKLMINDAMSEVVLFKADKTGTVISSPNPDRIGVSGTNFTMTPFADLQEAITLQNVPE